MSSEIIDKFIEWVLENELYAYDSDKNEILYLAELKRLYTKFIKIWTTVDDFEEDEDFSIKILPTGYVIRCDLDKKIMKYDHSIKSYFCDECGLLITVEIEDVGFTKLTEEGLRGLEQHRLYEKNKKIREEKSKNGRK